jgi:signal transduction histidine kinase
VIEEVSEMNGARVSEGVEVELTLDPEVVVMADPSQLTAVVWNLWNNAIEAMDGAGRLSVRVLRVSEDAAQEHEPLDRKGEGRGAAAGPRSACTAVLEIEDSGPGISPEIQEMIFEPFYTTKRDGTGLGLATVQRLVEQHGGSIQVSSQLGSGTCFRVFLTCAERV